jgi:5-methylcytosine-specific restriction enzyme A
MPTTPQRFCTVTGCQARVSSGRCQAHQRQTQQVKDERRGTRHERGYTNRWAAYSQRRLAQHPWCVGYPQGRHDAAPVLASCTDHIQPARARSDLFWEPSNHQSLCRACNSQKGDRA